MVAQGSPVVPAGRPHRSAEYRAHVVHPPHAGRRQLGFVRLEALEDPTEIAAKLITARHVYDLRRNSYVGFTDTIRFRLDPWEPALFALTENKLGEGDPLGALLRQLPPSALSSSP